MQVRGAPSRTARRQAGGCLEVLAAGAEPCRAALAARPGIGVQSALLPGFVDPRDEQPMLALGRRIIAGPHRVLQAAEVGSDRAGEAAVLQPLPLGALVPLLLRGDVGHRAAGDYSGC